MDQSIVLSKQPTERPSRRDKLQTLVSQLHPVLAAGQIKGLPRQVGVLDAKQQVAGKGMQHQNLLHQGQVFDIVVGGKKQLARVQFGQDATSGPNIRGRVPARAQYNLGCAVLARVDEGTLAFVIVGGSTEINEFDRILFGNLVGFPSPLQFFLVCTSKQDIFWFQVRVAESKSVQEFECF
eukprot:CAMPEP_0118676146 /NCGR_PEP_ID=MMETSP0800-20121206/1875_1 /TAXON_ID=210618 ORGANISM="Striatella unipunctata, Strain CCMP2910" /NCGR_SAMPLE_ID=MMETSP0800 /ASSEMBLY_ACC=CAM_ASM_000638 /LENGTH=180 /DNA_ID=CAMNT_0006571607 /DNA_START=134 /DNA_END=679 /DNA_ORIENTATION=+